MRKIIFQIGTILAICLIFTATFFSISKDKKDDLLIDNGYVLKDNYYIDYTYKMIDEEDRILVTKGIKDYCYVMLDGEKDYYTFPTSYTINVS